MILSYEKTKHIIPEDLQFQIIYDLLSAVTLSVDKYKFQTEFCICLYVQLILWYWIKLASMNMSRNNLPKMSMPFAKF